MCTIDLLFVLIYSNSDPPIYYLLMCGVLHYITHQRLVKEVAKREESKLKREKRDALRAAEKKKALKKDEKPKKRKRKGRNEVLMHNWR